ncbi:MAG: sugar metabolism transcriptional regulator [Methylomonas sp.]|nr:MAG: sugar metabolism transcriptional regulator [Methylomonas sp.]PPD25431.1 MAG: sugar metabolism transcriptional regulator [Methylomonas sp.]PPD36079.1 MAG: sugar metabolism transcriptional regulator [Methylomonas sp.]PPD42742.1 MAG: sugar metabolism transcriptional regulator [Methylomonas sp.]PPD51558.1 MAG: sugar metabolism transcriptional regulator [Methylomonas sp.]
MILAELRDYLQEKKRVSLNDLVMRFQVDAEALRGMLSKWISKGRLKKSQAGANCGGSCCKCDPALTEIYEWIESKTTTD